MKIFIKTMMVAVITAISFMALSCSSDEPSGKVSKDQIIGFWKTDVAEFDDDWYSIAYYQFKENDTYVIVEITSYPWIDGVRKDVDKSYGEWSINGKKITLSDGTSGTIKSISNSKMVIDAEIMLGDISYGSATMTLNRCSASEMNQYLDE